MPTFDLTWKARSEKPVREKLEEISLIENTCPSSPLKDTLSNRQFISNKNKLSVKTKKIPFLLAKKETSVYNVE